MTKRKYFSTLMIVLIPSLLFIYYLLCYLSSTVLVEISKFDFLSNIRYFALDLSSNLVITPVFILLNLALIAFYYLNNNYKIVTGNVLCVISIILEIIWLAFYIVRMYYSNFIYIDYSPVSFSYLTGFVYLLKALSILFLFIALIVAIYDFVCDKIVKFYISIYVVEIAIIHLVTSIRFPISFSYVGGNFLMLVVSIVYAFAYVFTIYVLVNEKKKIRAVGYFTTLLSSLVIILPIAILSTIFVLYPLFKTIFEMIIPTFI